MGELSFVLDCRLSARPKFVEKTSTVIPVIHLLRRQCTVKMTKLKCLALCISPRRTIRIHILMKMYLITCDGRVLHTHGSSGVVSFNVGHRHGYTGITEPAPSDAPRTHAYSTVTTFNDGHEHFIRGRTGPAIPLPGGGHYHYFEGVTTVNGRTPHSHAYNGRTGNER